MDKQDTRKKRATKADANNGIHGGKYEHVQRVAVNTHQNFYGDIWRAVVASGSEGLKIPLGFYRRH